MDKNEWEGKPIIDEIFFSNLGKVKFQKFFERLQQISLEGMNMGKENLVTEFLEDSGEEISLEYVKNHIASTDKIIAFDVGANAGYYSRLLKQVFEEKAVIYAFEPSYKIFQTLQTNIGGVTNIKLYCFGFGDKNEKMTLFRASGNDTSGMSSVYKRRLDHFNINMNQGEMVEIKTIDSFCLEQKISHIHFLKLDVEGHEKKVLDGASKMIKSGSIDFIQFEFGGTDIDSRIFFQDFYYLLNENYKIYRIVKDGLFPITRYKQYYEVFMLANYLAEKR